MAKNFKSLTESEKKELKDLIAKKKAKTLTEDESKRLSELNDKCGFRSGKSNSKEGFRPGNDFSWWNKRYDLLKDAANYKCNYVAGEQVGDTFDFVIPGVLTVDLLDVFGIASRQTDPINIWSRDLFLKMHQKFRVPTKYGQSDLGITGIATIMLFAIVAYYERVYGIINRYSVLNKNMPFTETRALGLSDYTADFLRTHLSDFRYDLNELISRAQNVCIPKDISLILDKISLYGYEYLDHDSVRSQIIMFRPKYYATYEDTLLQSGGSVRFNPIDYTDDSVWFNTNVDDDSNMCVMLEEMIEKLLNSTSVVTIYADLITWFGEDSMLHLLPVPEDYVVVPVYSESILHKLHNCESPFRGYIDEADGEFYDTFVSVVPQGMSEADEAKLFSGYFVYQYNDTIISRPAVSNTYQPTAYVVGNWKYPVSQNRGTGFNLTEHLLDAYREDLSEEIVTEGVLFKCAIKSITSANDGDCTNISSCAFEIPLSFRLWKSDSETPARIYSGNLSDEFMEEFAAAMALIDWAPLSYAGDEPETGQVSNIYGDVDNLVLVPNTGLSKLHRAILYSGMNTDVQVKGK